MDDLGVYPMSNIWTDTVGQNQFGGNKIYVVQTALPVIRRCILMTTDPGDLVLDPTCGAGTAAYVAEQWGRRWITIDTSRVALALARARLMGARYAWYLLADSPEGQRKLAELRGRELSEAPTYGDLRQGFVYQRVPHITLRDIANNPDIDAIYARHQERLEPLRAQLNAALGQSWPEWEIPAEAAAEWPEAARERHTEWQAARRARQGEIDASIAASANYELLYDRPYEDRARVRVCGPFTVESLSPHQVRPADEDGEFYDGAAPSVHPATGSGRTDGATLGDTAAGGSGSGDSRPVHPAGAAHSVHPAGAAHSVHPAGAAHSVHPEPVAGGTEWAAETGPGYRTGREPEGRPEFAAMILEQLRVHGVQQSDKADRIEFTSFEGWPGGGYICAEGRFMEGETERRAGIFLGPEFGTVGRPDLAAAGREARENGFDLLLVCAFSYDAHAGELKRLGPLRILQARMNADLHMAGDLQGKGNLFVIFGEPDIALEPVPPDDPDYPAAADSPSGNAAAHPDAGAPELFRVRIHGVDFYQPSTGQTQSDDTDGIACWFVDTDYDGESFFVRQAYFLGASSDPYKALKSTLRAEIDAEAWESLRRAYSRPFPKPPSGRIAVKVINHLGDEALKALELR